MVEFFLYIMSSVKIENISETRKRVVVPVTAEQLAKTEQTVLKSVMAEAKLPGFRPGHAPEAMVRARYGEFITSEVNQRTVSDAYQTALKEAGLDFCSVVNVENDPVKSGKNAVVKVTVDIYPEFKLPQYKELEVKLPKLVVDEKEVDDTLGLIRGQRAQFTPVERAAAAGDYVRLAYKGTLGGKPVAEIVTDRPIYGEQKNTWEEAGDHEYGIKAISTGIIGMAKGDKKSVEQKFEKDFEVKPLAGATVSYEIEVLEVREKKLPEMDEAFFKSLGVKDIEELKTQIRNSVEARAKRDAEDAKRSQLSDKLIASVKCGLPESLISSETQGILDELISENQRRGISEEKIKEKQKELVDAARDGAQKRVKLRMILRKVANEEKLDVSEDDFRGWVMSEAAQRQTSPDKIVKELSADRERMANLSQALKLSKAMKLIVDAAKITEVEAKPEPAKKK